MRVLGVVTCLLACVLGCGGGGGGTMDETFSLEVSPVSASLDVGETIQLTATQYFPSGETMVVTDATDWSSDNEAVATVSIAGVVTGHKAGTARIEASYDGVPAFATVQVNAVVPHLASITVTPKDEMIPEGTDMRYSAEGVYSDGLTIDLSEMVTWSTGSSSIATITPGGLATGVGQGTTTVIATYKPGTSEQLVGMTGLTVISPTIQTLSISPGSAMVAKGKTTRFSLMATYTNGAVVDISEMAIWSSTAPSIATVSNTPAMRGIATGVTQGTTVVQATFMGAPYGANLTVTAPVLDGVEIRPDNAMIPLGAGEAYTAYAIFSDGSEMFITHNFLTWSTMPTSRMSIDNLGGALGLSQGSAIVSVTYMGFMDTANATIVAPVLSTIDITPKNADVLVGTSVQYMAMGTFTDGSMMDVTNIVTWESQDTSIATIAAGGLLTSLAVGTTMISATGMGHIGPTSAFTDFTAHGLPTLVVTTTSSPIPNGGTESVGLKTAGQAFSTVFTLKNTGSGPLTVSAASFTSQTACAGSVPGFTTLTIPPGGMATLTTSVTPSGGPFQCQLELMTNDPNNNPYAVTIRGGTF